MTSGNRPCSAHAQNEVKVTGHLVMAVCATALGSALPFGYNLAVVNNPQQIIVAFINSSYYENNDAYMPQSTLMLIWAVVVSILCAGAMLGSIVGSYMGNRFGSKFALLTSNIAMAIGAAIIWSSKIAGSYEMIIAARFILGMSVGLNSAVAPVYLSEIATVRLRGMIGTIHQLAFVLGILLAMILGLNMALGTEDLWHVLLALTGVPVIYQLVTLTWCPESPVHLLVNKRDDETARKALVWLRQTQHVDAELEELRSQRYIHDNREKFVFWDFFSKRRYRKPLLISIMLHLSLQFSGITGVLSYSTSIFQIASLSQQNGQWATIGIGGVFFLMTFVSAAAIDRAGRRVLQLTGLGGACIATIVLTIGLELQDKADWLTFVPVAALVLFIISFALGPGSIPWIVTAELFTEEARFAAVSVCVPVNWLANTAVGLVFPTFRDSFGSYMFIPFTVFLVIFWVFTFFMLPETKGKTFQEISKSFDSQKQQSEDMSSDIKIVSTML